jgi:phage-related protein
MKDFKYLIENFFTHKDFLAPANELPGTMFTPLHFIVAGIFLALVIVFAIILIKHPKHVKTVFITIWAVVTVFEVIKIVWDVVASYFTTIWNNIKEVFAVVKTYFEGMFKTAWEAVKFVWDAVVGYFTAIWDSIALVFSVVKNVLTGNWKEAWEGIKGIVNTWKEYFSGVWDGIKNVFGAVKEWFSTTFSAAWTAIKNIFNNWSTFFSGLWDNVKKAFGVAKEWLSSTFSSAWEGIKKIFSNWGSFFSGLWDTIKNTFSSLGTKLGSAIGDAVKSGINGVLTMIENTINKGINMLNGAVDLINKIPGVNIGKFQKINLPRLAKGGIVDSATIAMIGEAGKEAVVPLENNTEWIDKLADRLAEKSNTPSKIVLTLDGKELGWANIRSINNITKQTGSLPLVIV